MLIKKLNNNLVNVYKKFLQDHPYAMFYHSIKYKNFLEKILECKAEYLLLCDNKNNIYGILPLMIKNGIYGKVINSLPFYGSHGSVLTTKVAYEKFLLDKYNKLLQKKDILSSTVITNPLDEKFHKFKHNFKDERIGQWTNIKKINKEILLNKIDSSARRNIRKAIKNDIQVEINNNSTDFLKELHKDNMSVLGGLPKDDNFFELVLEQFEPGIDFNIYIASKKQKPIAALLLFYFKNIVEYFMPVINQDFKSDQPLPLIIYRAMLDASQNNLDWWNWGGTWLNQEGLYKFKKKWDTIDKPYFYYTNCEKGKFKSLKKEDLLQNYKNFYIIPFGQVFNEKN